MKAAKILEAFLGEIKRESKNIVIDDLDDELLKELLAPNKKKSLNEMDQEEMIELKEKYGLEFQPGEEELFYLSSTLLEWSRPEKKEKEGFVQGGFSFNGMREIAKFKTEFWKKSLEVFKEVKEESPTKIEQLENLRWFESPTPYRDANYTPQFGCINLKKGKGFPRDFYFYDSGLVFALPFKSYVEYIEALTNSAAVTCWQYFYVEPEEIVTKNSRLNYITWSLHTLSNLEPGIGEMNLNKNIKSDRLDLILEYLERCVRLLPSSFPFLDFTHHKKHYEEIRRAYLKQKKK